MKQLFEEITLGGIPVKNRIVRSATGERNADQQGRCTPALTAFFETLAKNGAGTIITGQVGVDENSCSALTMLRAYDETFPSGLQAICQAVHRHGARLVVQISHAGSRSIVTTPPNSPVVPSLLEGKACRELTVDQIHEIARAFGTTAARCKEAGADGVQIHAGHGYLISQFLCPRFNHRTDEYGGPIENRARLLFEAYDAIRDAVGPDYPVWIKINSTDGIEDGMTFEESQQICRQLSQRGLHAIEVSSLGIASRAARLHAPGTPEGFNFEAADILSGQVSADVISVGGYRTAEAMMDHLNRSGIKAVALSRPLISDPDIILRWQTGESVRSRCVSCNRCFDPSPLSCKTFPAE